MTRNEQLFLLLVQTDAISRDATASRHMAAKCMGKAAKITEQVDQLVLSDPDNRDVGYYAESFVEWVYDLAGEGEPEWHKIIRGAVEKPEEPVKFPTDLAVTLTCPEEDTWTTANVDVYESGKVRIADWTISREDFQQIVQRRANAMPF